MPRISTVGLFIFALGISNIQAQDPASVVDSLMAPYAHTGAPGGVITVVQNGEVIFMRAYGMASLEQRTAITTSTIFDIGSVAKQFTGFALALLAEDGALDLEDDIRDYLPEVPDFGHRITIQNLLNHTSGLREIYDSKAIAGWQGGDGIEQREALSVTAAMRELNFDPGTEYMYCNTAYMLLADIVSRVSGTPFPDWMQAHVFDPLGMENTEIMDTLGEVIHGAADSYAPTDDEGFRRIFDNSSAYGQGGIYTNAPDMAKWLANFGSMDIRGAAVRSRLSTRGVLANGDTLTYALGINVTSFRGQAALRHGGASAGFRSNLAFFPAINAGVFIQSNRTDLPSGLLDDVALAFFPDSFASPPSGSPRSERRADTADEFEPRGVSEYEGRYFSQEVETLYTVRLDGQGIEIHHWRQGASGLNPVGIDLFEGRLGSVRFERTAGRVSGFRVTTGRVRNLLFERMD